MIPKLNMHPSPAIVASRGIPLAYLPDAEYELVKRMSKAQVQAYEQNLTLKIARQKQRRGIRG